MVYGHYAVMGGFAADVEKIHNVATRVSITPTGVLFLAKVGHFCRVPRSHIEDKSKADIFAKGLVCIQVLWVAGQAIERKLAGYPITLLEIHTHVHVICAPVMYGLCAQKPHNVQDPTMILFEDDQGALAFMLETSQKRFSGRYKGSLSNVSRSLTVRSAMVYYPAEYPIVLLNRTVPQCVPVGSRYNVNEPHYQWPRIIRDLTVREDGHELAKTSTFYCSSHKDHEGQEHCYTMGPALKRFLPRSSQPVICTVYLGQVLSFPGQGSSFGIGLQLPSFIQQLANWSAPEQQIGTKFVYRRVLTTSIGEYITMASLSPKDVRRLALVSTWVSSLEQSLKISNIDENASLGREISGNQNRDDF